MSGLLQQLHKNALVIYFVKFIAHNFTPASFNGKWALIVVNNKHPVGNNAIKDFIQEMKREEKPSLLACFSIFKVKYYLFEIVLQ